LEILAYVLWVAASDSHLRVDGKWKWHRSGDLDDGFLMFLDKLFMVSDGFEEMFDNFGCFDGV